MRAALSKKTRFEVFKRDEFQCQYCGAHPPQVILHVDHIHPVAEGGTNDIDNLVTACEPCNQGKGARLLSAVPDSLATRAAMVAEAEEQLRGYRAVMDAKQSRIDDDAWGVVAVWERPDANGQLSFNRSNLNSIKRFLQKLDFHTVKDAAELAQARVPYSESRRFRYFCAVCWGRIRDQSNARP